MSPDQHSYPADRRLDDAAGSKDPDAARSAAKAAAAAEARQAGPVQFDPSKAARAKASGAHEKRNSAARFVLRAAPPKAQGMPSRKILLSGAMLLGGLVAFALVTGLSPRDRTRNDATDRAFRPAIAPESVRNGPSDYAQISGASENAAADFGDAEFLEASLAPPADPQFSEGGSADQGVAGRGLPPAGAFGVERQPGRFAAIDRGDGGGGDESEAAARTAPILFGGAASSGRAAKDDMVLPSRLQAPSNAYVLQAGSVIPAALRTELNSEAPGRVVAQVTAPVYDSLTGEHLLAPQGSRLLGTYESGTRYGEHRIRIVWNRLILPSGYGIDLQEMAAVDQAGAAGLRAHVDDHIGRVAAASVISGALSTAANAAQDRRSSVFAQSVGDAAAQEAARVGGRIVDRELDVRPTLRIPAGARIKVLIERDLILRSGGR